MKAARWSLLAGNFAIGCGVMVTAGALNDIVRALQVPVAMGGQLITAGAVVMALGAPLLAAAVAGVDRRRLLVLALLWFGIGHALCALVDNFAWLLALRALSVVGAAVFTPQAAAAINVMVPAAERGQAIAFVFLGWSLASVLGMPMHSYIAEAVGWPWAFALVALLSLLAALAVWRSMPDGVKPAALSLASWRQVLTHPLMMGVVAVTAISAAGQFAVFSYMAPYYHQVLGADAAAISLLFFTFGAMGVAGNLLLTRWIGRLGAARCATLALAAMALSLLLWPLGRSVPLMLLVLLPWGLGCFSSNSAQQARLGQAAPHWAPALMALNSSAIYLGQAVGAGSGGLLLNAYGLAVLPAWALAWMLAATALSLWLTRRMKESPHG